MMEEFLASGVHWKLFNFFLFAGILFFVLRKPIKDYWQTRAHAIQFEMDEAGKLARDAQAQYDQLRQRVSRLESEAQGLIRSLEQEGDAEKKRIMEEADKAAARLKSDGERIMAQEVRRARESLKAQAVQLAVETAEKMIRDNFNDADQKRLSEQYLTNLEKGAA